MPYQKLRLLPKSALCLKRGNSTSFVSATGQANVCVLEYRCVYKIISRIILLFRPPDLSSRRHQTVISFVGFVQSISSVTSPLHSFPSVDDLKITFIRWLLFFFFLYKYYFKTTFITNYKGSHKRTRDPTGRVTIAYPAKLVKNRRMIHDEFPDWFEVLRVIRASGFECDTDESDDETDIQMGSQGRGNRRPFRPWQAGNKPDAHSAPHDVMEGSDRIHRICNNHSASLRELAVKCLLKRNSIVIVRSRRK